MKNKDKFFLFIVSLLIFSPVNFALAHTMISEIMYDLPGTDEGREWIEIYNHQDTPFDLSTLKFFEGDTNHKLKLIQGDANILVGSYALIVSDAEKFKKDNPNFFTASSGTPPEAVAIFDSTFSLSNTGEVVALKDQNLETVSQFNYDSNMGAGGDGKSLQFVDSKWVASAPTPGGENKFLQPKPKITSITKTEQENKIIETKTEKISPPFLEENSSLASVSVDNSEVTSKDSQIFTYIFGVFLLFCAYFTYIFRQNRIKPKLGENFEILGE